MYTQFDATAGVNTTTSGAFLHMCLCKSGVIGFSFTASDLVGQCCINTTVCMLHGKNRYDNLI